MHRPSQLLAGTLLAALAMSGHAGTTLNTVIAAPVGAIALGPTSASVQVNNQLRPGVHTVYIGRPLIAVSTPWHQMHIRVRRFQS